jgi:hypothetical protein
VPRNPVLAGVELAPDDAVLAERPANRLGDGAQRAVGVELLADGARARQDRGVLLSSVMPCRVGEKRTLWGMASVPFFSPSLSAAEVVWSDMPGVDVEELPKSCVWRGPVDLGMATLIDVRRCEDETLGYIFVVRQDHVMTSCIAMS